MGEWVDDWSFVRIIDLDGNPERLARIYGASRARRPRPEPATATDGRCQPRQAFWPRYLPVLARLWFGRPLTWSEIGRDLSHLRAARAFRDSGAPYGLMLEDKAVLAADFGDSLAALRARLEAGWAPSWWLINLGEVPNDPRHYHPVVRLTAGAALCH